jgi:hypothetical protein
MNTKLFSILSKAGLSLFLNLHFYGAAHSQALLFGNPEKAHLEIGLAFGPSFFLGDLGGNRGKGTTFIKDLNFRFTKLSKGAFATLYPFEWIGLRGALNYTYLEGDDAVIKSKGGLEDSRKKRNLNFRSNVWEAYGAVELYPFQFLTRNKEIQLRWKPYIFIGAGIFHFNPTGSITDNMGNKKWYALHPLKTEGQGMPEYPDNKEYKLTQTNIPYGGGVKYQVSERLTIGTEIHYRKTFTDYIDDVSKTYINVENFGKNLGPEKAELAVLLSDKSIGFYNPLTNRYPEGSPRGDPKQVDTYFSLVTVVGYKVGAKIKPGGRKGSLKQTKCPGIF